jgi:DNA-binding MarR family transcriptional regulator
MSNGKQVVKKQSNNYEAAIEGYVLFHLLRQTADAIHKSRELELKSYGISPQQSGALVCIRTLGKKATPAELSRWLFREPNSVTILLNRMQRMGLIKKKADTKRKNLIRLSLTKKGNEAYKHAIEMETFYSLVENLPEKKRKQLWSLLQEIREQVFKDLHLDVSHYSGCLDETIMKTIMTETDGSDTDKDGDIPQATAAGKS